MHRRILIALPRLLFPLAACLSLLAAAGLPDVVAAKEAQWIWWPEHVRDQVPAVTCYFRRSFMLQTPREGQVAIMADDAYELYVNGREVQRGQYEKDLKQIDISGYLAPGRNTVAIKVSNLKGPTAAVAARVMVRQQSGWSSYSTDRSWKAALRPLPLWNTSLYNDRQWQAAQEFGQLGSTAPWDRRQEIAAQDQHRAERFTVGDEFAVYRVLDGKDTGSLIAMTFNEFGHIIASREGGPLLLIYDSDGDQRPDRTRVYCEAVKNCQGILALNGDVFVTGEGPSGLGLYRLIDTQHQGKLDEIRLLLKFRGEAGEHAAHGLSLGPDGLIYVVLGNHVQPDLDYDPASPHRNYYEGDLFAPRYEDPGGHAAGIKAPGGTIIRTDVQGRSVELVAGGLRNAYDLAFNAEGELFVHDSDMESDAGSSWYRPTTLFHIVPGGEYGWRSGWAKWPSYFVDSLPGVADTGRGSPAGSVVYNHYSFPARYHNAIFLADWSQGRILVARTKRNGAGFTADTETFLQGQPLNVTDLDVGPDGSLYFCTGGRGTSGGIYQVSWKGQVPASVKNLGTGISQVIKQPQLQSAWARQQAAAVKQQLGTRWDPMLVGVAVSTANSEAYRMRALDLMQLLGPAPSTDLLVSLASAKSEGVRAKSAELLGLHSGAQAADALRQLLADSDRGVRRKACEALARLGETAPYATLVPLLKSDDRHEAWAARRLLERLPADTWKDQVLAEDDHRLLIQGGLALMISQPSAAHARAIIDRARQAMLGFVSDRDFVDLLRVLQVALHRGQPDLETLAEFREQLQEEFPAGHETMNRELIRLLIHLRADAILDRYLAYLESDASQADKLHLALHLRFLDSGWTPSRRRQLLTFLEQAHGMESGNSVPHYVRNVARDFVKQLTAEEALEILAAGDQLPTAALGALYRLPTELDEPTRELLQELDARLSDVKGEPAERLQVGIVAVLARTGDDDCHAYLRQVWDQQPERRATLAMGLAQKPDGENWPYLLRSLPVLQGGLAAEVLQQLLDVDRQPDEPEPIRQVILRGLVLGEDGGRLALDLLAAWTGQEVADPKDSLEQALGKWQQWFARTWPEHPPAELPRQTETNKWQFAELLEYLEGEQAAQASSARGAELFARAQCAKCHRFGDRGESVGPDLTHIERRFTRRELLESIMFPSHVISSQYGSKRVVTTDGRVLTGMLVNTADGETVLLQSDGEKLTLRADQIEEVQSSKVSSMPEGLLNDLSLEEIADLFAYLRNQSPVNVARQPDAAESK
ncbi:MAG: HEAT repeat domain-containing protein [Pirellulaceae bacterium]|nr:HEAT repeat domain-containing protein [Pirellulaceae bacterium]